MGKELEGEEREGVEKDSRFLALAHGVVLMLNEQCEEEEFQELSRCHNRPAWVGSPLHHRPLVSWATLEK